MWLFVVSQVFLHFPSGCCLGCGCHLFSVRVKNIFFICFLFNTVRIPCIDQECFYLFSCCFIRFLYQTSPSSVVVFIIIVCFINLLCLPLKSSLAFCGSGRTVIDRTRLLESMWSPKCAETIAYCKYHTTHSLLWNASAYGGSLWTTEDGVYK